MGVVGNDKIIQIAVDSAPEGKIWGLSETGRLYEFVGENEGWEFVCESPEEI